MQINSKIHYLAGYQVLAGVSGLIISGNYMIGVNTSNLSLLVVIVFFLLLYLHLLISGLLIFRNEKSGLIHSAINQGLQIISFSLMGLSYQYYAGPSLNFTWEMTGSFWPYVTLGFSSWELIIVADTGISSFGFNIVALIAYLFILKKLREIKAERINQTVADIGN